MIKHHLSRGLFVLGCLIGSAGAMAAPRITDGVVTDERGMSLYWWNNDVPGSGKSVCIAACALSWPPMLAQAGAKPEGDFSLITRDDGAQQWAHKGRPLYLWVNDTKPGDRSGDGFRNGLWHLARP